MKKPLIDEEMNASVITKIEYKLPEETEFSEIEFIPESGKFNQESKLTGSGLLYTAKIDFNIAGITIQADTLIKKLDNRPSVFRLIDSNGLIIIMGTDRYPSRMLAKSALDGSPGSFAGYRCSVTQVSPLGCTFS